MFVLNHPNTHKSSSQQQCNCDFELIQSPGSDKIQDSHSTNRGEVLPGHTLDYIYSPELIVKSNLCFLNNVNQKHSTLKLSIIFVCLLLGFWGEGDGNGD